MSDPTDQILVVLRECEAKLRTLAVDGRLSVNALTTFADLASQIRKEIERRKGEDRRQFVRGTADRRMTPDVPVESAAAADWRYQHRD